MLLEEHLVKHRQVAERMQVVERILVDIGEEVLGLVDIEEEVLDQVDIEEEVLSLVDKQEEGLRDISHNLVDGLEVVLMDIDFDYILYYSLIFLQLQFPQQRPLLQLLILQQPPLLHLHNSHLCFSKLHRLHKHIYKG